MTKSAAAFKRTEEVQLPSGLTVEVRKPDISRLVMESKDGSVPAFLQQQVVAGLAGKAETVDDWDPSKEDLATMSRFMDMVVRAALVWPVIVDGNPDYDAGQISLHDLEQADRTFLFGWAMPDSNAAAGRFRAKQNGAVEPVPDV